MPSTTTGMPLEPRCARTVYRVLATPVKRPGQARGKATKPTPTWPQLLDLYERVMPFNTPHSGDISAALAWLLLAGAVRRDYDHSGAERYTALPFTFPPATEF